MILLAGISGTFFGKRQRRREFSPLSKLGYPVSGARQEAPRPNAVRLRGNDGAMTPGATVLPMRPRRTIWIEHWPFFRGFHRVIYELGCLQVQQPPSRLPRLDHELPIIPEGMSRDADADHLNALSDQFSLQRRP